LEQWKKVLPSTQSSENTLLQPFLSTDKIKEKP